MFLLLTFLPYILILQVTHTQTKVLPSRDVLFKYLNKNLVFVATVTPKAPRLAGAANPEESTMVAYLIDTVSGRILHRVSHPNMQGPVHAVSNISSSLFLMEMVPNDETVRNSSTMIAEHTIPKSRWCNLVESKEGFELMSFLCCRS